MTTLLLIQDITVYNADGLFARFFGTGMTVRGKYDYLLGGYACTEDGITFFVYRDEAVVC
jgi:hypothetical protein